MTNVPAMTTKMSKEAFEAFWNAIRSFPLGLYCEKHAYDWQLKKLPKDCATCMHLREGRCSQRRIPDKIH